MGENSEKYFKKVYLIFGIFFVLLCLAEFLHLAVYTGSLMTIKLFLSYTLLLALACTGFIFFVKRGVQLVFTELGRLMDVAESGQAVPVETAETELSKFGERLLHYMSIQNHHAKKYENQKAQAEALISDISHQTKTPIANIMIWGQLLETMDLSEKAREYVSKITGQTERLKWMIETMVNMSRLETGLIQCHPEPNKVIDLVVQSLNQVYEKAEKKEIDLSIDCDHQIKALFDLKWTAEAVTNILDNSIKYTDFKGRVSVHVTPYELYTRIDIKDNGIGIDPSEWNDIFKRFYRSPQVKNEEGVGIGLYLCRKIITLQSGYIKMESVCQEGTTFSVFLPNVR